MRERANVFISGNGPASIGVVGPMLRIHRRPTLAMVRRAESRGREAKTAP